MKPDQIVLVTAQRWVQLRNGKAVELKAWADVEGPALVLVDLPDCHIGVQSSKGKAEYAAAQIEKAVRSEGSLEGPLQVFVHQQVRHAGSTQTLYTALPLPMWQRLQAWSADQADHCLILPLAGVLARTEDDGRIHILRAGSQLIGYRLLEKRMRYAAATVLGDSAADLRGPMRTLMSQLGVSGSDAASRVVRWSCILSADIDSERMVVDAFNDAKTFQAELVPHDVFEGAEGTPLASALPYLLDSTPPSAIAAPWLPRFAWLSETYVLPLVAMLGVIALGLAGLSIATQRMAASETQAALQSRGEIDTLRQRVAAAAQASALAVDAEAIKFVGDLAFAASHNPVEMLAAVRRAAGSRIRIQRLQLVKATAAATLPQFRVDGVVDDGSNESVGRFLAEMRSQGWSAEPAVPTDGALGAFAYVLKPVSAANRS